MTSDTTPSHAIGGKLGQVAGRSDSGKSIVHTIDPDFILGIAKVSEFGARKYHMRNFLMAPGMAWSQVYGSAMRHFLLWWSGEELDIGPNGEYGETDDPETNMKWSGLPHIDHVAWNIMVLRTYSLRDVYQPGDDRPSTLEYAGGIWKDWQTEFDAIRELDAKVNPVKEERHGSDLNHPLDAAREKPAMTPGELVSEMSARLKTLGYDGTVSLSNKSIIISI